MKLSRASFDEVTSVEAGIQVALLLVVSFETKQTVSDCRWWLTGGFFRVCLILLLVAQVNTVCANQVQTAAADPAIPAFDERVKQYIKLRKKTEVPKLSDKSKPEQIEAQKASLQASIMIARAGAKPGDIFTPDIARYIRGAIRREFKGERLRKLRETIRAAETKGVAMRVNVAYPETTELIEMPPTLLLNLPALPKELQYRLVGGYLLLVDKEARLIVDYMAGAVPRPATPAR